MYVCLCNAITEREVRECAHRLGARSVEDLTAHLGLGAGCGRCLDCACQVLAEAQATVKTGA